MIETKLKLWSAAGVLAAFGLAACGAEGGEGGTPSAGEAGEAAIQGEAGEAAIGETGAEHGEAGVISAYAGVAGDQRTALRLQQLKGFVLIAARLAQAGATDEAGMLVMQGMLEVYEPASDQFGALDVGIVRAAAEGPSAQSLAEASRALDAARPGAADYAALTVSMVDIASGLYRNVATPEGVDPIEYQHSLGAALAARDALAAGRADLRTRDARAYDRAARELDRLVSLWPASAAPDQPTPFREVLAQSSRVRLALSPFL